MCHSEKLVSLSSVVAEIELDWHEPLGSDFAKALSEDIWASLPPCAGVVFMPLRPSAAGADATAHNDGMYQCRCFSQLTQALVKVSESGGMQSTGDRATPRLWLVTRGAQAVGELEAADADALAQRLVQSAIIGVGKVVALEQTPLRVSMIDLVPDAASSTDTAGSADGEAALLAAELQADQDELQVAFRGSRAKPKRLAARLSQLKPKAKGQVSFSAADG